MAGELVEMLEKLPEREKKRLAELEVVIKKDLKAFLRVGAALAEISNNRLYRQDYHTFPDYLKGTWDLGESRGYQLIDAHVVVDKLKTSTNGGGFEILPQNERQTRPLIKYKDDPEKLAQIWNRAVETAPDGKVTAKRVQLALFDVLGKKTKDDTGKRRAAVRRDKGVSEPFKEAFETMLQELERESMSRYKTSNRQSMINHIDGLRAVISEEGDRFGYDHWGKSDYKKLTNAGLTLYRKRQIGEKKDPQLTACLIIEKADNTVPGWQFVKEYTEEAECDADLGRLIESDTAVRC